MIRHDPTLCFGANALVTRPIAHIQSPRHKCDYQAINHWKDAERAIVSEPHNGVCLVGDVAVLSGQRLCSEHIRSAETKN